MNLRKGIGLILVLTLTLTVASWRVAESSANIDFAFSFHDALAPYGTWVQVSSYGQCWRPRVSTGFVPYTDGHWVYTSYGPTWVGYEPWAWCAYHYGQWVYSPEFGWVWVPGYQWTPGRVVWATGPDYIGWSPYLGSGVNTNFWVVVNRDNFRSYNYAGHILRRDVVRNMFDRRVVRVHSGTLQRVEAERIIRRPIQVVRVKERQVVANGHNARLILPEGQEAAALKQISHISRKASVPVTNRKPVAQVSGKSFSKAPQH
jgi:hypothetical protein